MHLSRLPRSRPGTRTTVFALALLCACAGPAGPGDAARAMRVAGVQIDPETSSPVMLLEEQEGEHRRLPIWIGVHEARSIALAMENVATPRPNSHDLIQNILRGVEGSILRVVITELRDGTYYAVLEIKVAGRTVNVDSRPSDAIAVAIRSDTPVFATDDVLERAGLIPGRDDALDIDWKPLGSPSQDRKSQGH